MNAPKIHMRLQHLSLLLLLSQTPICAQTLYRCGNTFSQTPCATDAKKIEVKPAVGVDCSNHNHMFSDVCRGEFRSSIANSVTEAKDKVQKQINAMPPTVALPSEAIERNKQRCLARITAMLKDPESARLSEVTRAREPAPDYETNKGWFPSISYTVNVNAKNSYGGYTGSKVWLCSFDLKEQELLRARAFE
jgi:hypothetical protein